MAKKDLKFNAVKELPVNVTTGNLYFVTKDNKIYLALSDGEAASNVEAFGGQSAEIVEVYTKALTESEGIFKKEYTTEKNTLDLIDTLNDSASVYLKILVDTTTFFVGMDTYGYTSDTNPTFAGKVFTEGSMYVFTWT